MRKFPFAVGLGLSLVLAPAQAKVQFRWFTAMGNGGVQVAGIRNEAGTYFRISCVPEGTIGEGASLQFDRSGVKSASQPSAIQVVVDGESFLFELDQSGLTNLTPREQRTELTRLSSRLSASKSENFLVEIPKEDKVEIFSLKDVQKALGKAPHTIVEACR